MSVIHHTLLAHAYDEHGKILGEICRCSGPLVEQIETDALGHIFQHYIGVPFDVKYGWTDIRMWAENYPGSYQRPDVESSIQKMARSWSVPDQLQNCSRRHNSLWTSNAVRN